MQIAKLSDASKDAVPLMAIQRVSALMERDGNTIAVRVCGAMMEAWAIALDSIIICPQQSKAVDVYRTVMAVSAAYVPMWNRQIESYNESLDLMEIDPSRRWMQRYQPIPEGSKPTVYTLDRYTQSVSSTTERCYSRMPAVVVGIYSYEPRKVYGNVMDDSNDIVAKVIDAKTTLIGITNATLEMVMAGVQRYWGVQREYNPKLYQLGD